MHLTDWPDGDEYPNDPALVVAMDRVRDVCSSTSSIRKANGLRVRLPLAEVTVAAADAEALAPYVSIIADEVNVKSVRLTPDLASAGEFVLQVVPGQLGPRIGQAVQQVIKAVKAGDWTRSNSQVMAGGVELFDGEYSLKLVPTHASRSAALSGDAGVVVLDTTVTPELEAEGLARDLVRQVQVARREAGLEVSDRISLKVTVPSDWYYAVSTHDAFIRTETLATSLVLVVDEALTEPVVSAEIDPRS